MKTRLLAFPRPFKQLLGMALDMASALFTVWLAFSLRLEVWHQPVGNQWIAYILAPVLIIPFFIRSGLYRAVFRYSGYEALIAVFKASLLYGIAFFLILLAFHPTGIPRTLGIIQPMLLLLVSGGSRAFLRFWFAGLVFTKDRQLGVERTLIYGAGTAGIEIADAILRSPRFYLAGFIDDDKGLQGRTILDMMVYSPEDAEEFVRCGSVTGILLAIPSESRARRNAIIERFHRYSVHIRTLPGLEALADGSVSISDIKEVEIEDLLGRDPLPMDQALLEQNITGRVVMVTGAGGSIGSELCRQLLAAGPSQLLLLDHAEFNLYAIHSDLSHRIAKAAHATELIPLLGDVTDTRRMRELCRHYAPSVIYHAAAYKHVPMVESNPAEGIRNNVMGTLSVAEAALQNNVECMILVSTDKAVRPTNIMGASKRVCELILQAMAAKRGHATCFSMVRFGNVLGSSGSVVPLFRKQIQDGGPVTVTHEEVTRYFMTIPEAAQLVIQAGAMAKGGDVFLLDMGEPVKIMDLARRMVELSGLTVCDKTKPQGDIPITITGLRPGEKLYEELLIGEQPAPTANPRIFKASEEFLPWAELRGVIGKMEAAIANDEKDLLVDQLKHLVPEYHSEPVGVRSITLEMQGIEGKRVAS